VCLLVIAIRLLEARRAKGGHETEMRGRAKGEVVPLKLTS